MPAKPPGTNITTGTAMATSIPMTGMDDRDGWQESVDNAALLKLLTMLSPAFPVGAFSYSHGLEWLIDQGTLASAGDVEAWISDLLEIGSGWNDAVLFAAAHDAAGEDVAALVEIAELGEALAGSRERHLETTAQGRAFLDAAAIGWESAPATMLRQRGGAPYPVAVAAVAAGERIPLQPALAAYLNAFAANLVSVAVRLVPLGQSAGLRIVAALHPVVEAVAARAASASLDYLGSATIGADIAAMRHETQYSRVFRT